LRKREQAGGKERTKKLFGHNPYIGIVAYYFVICYNPYIGIVAYYFVICYKLPFLIGKEMIR